MGNGHDATRQRQFTSSRSPRITVGMILCGCAGEFGTGVDFFELGKRVEGVFARILRTEVGMGRGSGMVGIVLFFL